MIEAISHLIHRDYEAIVVDFVTLGFIPGEDDSMHVETHIETELSIAFSHLVHRDYEAIVVDFVTLGFIPGEDTCLQRNLSLSQQPFDTLGLPSHHSGLSLLLGSIPGKNESTDIVLWLFMSAEPVPSFECHLNFYLCTYFSKILV